MLSNKVLVVSVHPDDETLGCGGTLLKHKSNGAEIYWLIVSSATQKQGYSNDFTSKRKKEISLVASKYDFSKVFQLELPTTELDTIPLKDLTKKIAAVITEILPNIIYIPFKGDVHSDHRIVFDAAFSCTKSFRYSCIKRVLMMEVLSETEFAPPMPGTSFIPNVFVNITDFIELKIEILDVYKNELGEHPFPRSKKNTKALALYRGATSGCRYAESFMLLKEIWK